MNENRETTAAVASDWTFLSNHAHVLLCLARDPDAPMREVATLVGITERAVQRIVGDLENAGYLVRDRQGRRNHYDICKGQFLRHPIERHVTISSMLELILGDDGAHEP